MTADEDSPTFDFEQTFDPDNYLPLYEDGVYELSASENGALSNSAADAEHIADLLDLSEDDHILDLACGHGRVANVLDKAGYDIHGLDASRGLLEVARDETATPAGPAYVQGDMRRLPYEADRFDAVYNIFNSFGYFADDENEQVIAEIARVVNGDGRVLMEIVDRDFVVRNLPGSRVYVSDDLVVADELAFDPETGRQITDRFLWRDGERVDFQYFLRLYTATEIRRVLERRGLDVERLYGDLRGSDYSIDTRSICLIARPE
ncbi:MAG: class I SAM-dependent methyltransferase [Halobellus sp.]|uniref:class I SAM-dependent methyltransferase n=1 Tax=Halobellus sp. TaxID=1979212 RepID=UPI0035D45443